jgi:DNA recombination protein RmuC
MISEVFWILLLVLAGAAGWFFSNRSYARGREEGHRQGRLEAELEASPLRDRAADAARRLAETEGRLETLRAEFLEASRANAGLQSELREVRAREPQVREALQRELTEFLEKKGKDLSRHNADSLQVILGPLREHISSFEKRVEDSHKEGRDQHVQLKTQIEGLFLMNQRLSLEAQNLTTALKGENKKGGNWGEVVLERVLESSGLEKGREYRVQPTYAGENGSQRPDIVIYLPDNRHLVVDSKLSLVAYERYCAAESPEAAELDLEAHVQSIRQHINDLSTKKYQEIHALNSVDFVFLFMPVEPAFIEASKRDPALFQAAFSRNIILVSPSTLLATLRTVESIWKQEYQNRHVREIARQAVALYEKFVGFLTDLDKVGKSLAATEASFQEARAKLATGKDNLVSKVERLRKLGVKSDKALPPSWRQDSDDGEEDPTAGRGQETLTLE